MNFSHITSTTVGLGLWHQGWSTGFPIDLKIAGSFDSIMLTPGLALLFLFYTMLDFKVLEGCFSFNIGA